MKAMLPPVYRWLSREPGPKILLEALALYGVREAAGAADNPELLAWAKECGIEYSHDAVAWCGLFAAVVVKRGGYPIVDSPLWALNWRTWGHTVLTPMLGDVLVFRRFVAGAGGKLEMRGHVGLYVGEDDGTVNAAGKVVHPAAYHVLGGNQSDGVTITRIEKTRLVAARRSPWKIAQPRNVRRVKLASAGALSTNEA